MCVVVSLVVFVWLLSFGVFVSRVSVCSLIVVFVLVIFITHSSCLTPVFHHCPLLPFSVFALRFVVVSCLLYVFFMCLLCLLVSFVVVLSFNDLVTTDV